MEWIQTFKTGPRLIAPPPPPAPAPPPGAQPLLALPYPAGLELGNSNGTQFPDPYNGETLIAADGLLRMGPVADPGGSGQMVTLHRVRPGDTNIWGGMRSEELWEQSSSGMVGTLTPGLRYCYGFAVMIKPGEMETGASAFDPFLVMQHHTPMNGDTQPPLSFIFASRDYDGHVDQLRIQKAWQANAPVSGSTDNAAPNGGTKDLYKGSLPAQGTWLKIVVDGVWSWRASDNPFLNIYASFDHGLWQQIVTDTGFNDYNPGGNPSYYSYVRIGLYKWTSGVWSNTDRIAVYETPIYLGQGAGLVENAKASMAAL